MAGPSITRIPPSKARLARIGARYSPGPPPLRPAATKSKPSTAYSRTWKEYTSAMRKRSSSAPPRACCAGQPGGSPDPEAKVSVEAPLHLATCMNVRDLPLRYPPIPVLKVDREGRSPRFASPSRRRARPGPPRTPMGGGRCKELDRPLIVCQDIEIQPCVHSRLQIHNGNLEHLHSRRCSSPLRHGRHGGRRNPCGWPLVESQRERNAGLDGERGEGRASAAD